MIKSNTKRLATISIISLLAGIALQSASTLYHKTEIPTPKLPPYLADTSAWTDSVYATLSLENKIAQSFMVPAYPAQGEAEKERVADLIRNHRVGGVIFFQGTPYQVASWSKYFQEISELPLLMAIDGEWGASMRLDSTIKYPRQSFLGAIQNNSLIVDMGRDIASQLNHLGIHVNFAPVADINSNPQNPVINSRSFGENRVNVAEKSLAYAQGMQSKRVIAVAKHFPGHGDTHLDSHYDLPIINHTMHHLDSLELYPFKYMVCNGVGGVMTAHMNVLSIDSTPNLPATLSPLAIDSLLVKQLGFRGLIFTDAMNMRGVSGHYGAVEANYLAYLAGNNILLMPHEIAKSIKVIEKAVKRNIIDTLKVNNAAKTILLAKDWAVNAVKQPAYSIDSINKLEHQLRKKKLIEHGITLIENKDSLLPIVNFDSLKLSAISLGNNGSVFQKTISHYYPVKIFEKGKLPFDTIVEHLKMYSAVFVSLHSDDYRASRNYGFNSEKVKQIEKLLDNKNVVLVCFAEPYMLKSIANLPSAKAIVVANSPDTLCQHVVAQSLFGAYAIQGKLPVGVHQKYPEGTGIKTQKLPVLQYTSAFEAGLNNNIFYRVDSLVHDAIQQKAMPGCQVLAARNGQVFFHKAYGHQTYRKRTPVNDQTIYDIASIAKIAATLPMLMVLTDKGEISIKKKLSEYLTELDTTNKADLVISDILSHQAGLYPWIPFYQKMIEPVYPSHDLFKQRYSDTYPVRVGASVYMNKHIRFIPNYVANKPDSTYNTQIAKNVYAGNSWNDTILYSIFESEVTEPGHYKYSDLGFILFYYAMEHLTEKLFEQLVDSTFYKRMGAYNLAYHPLQKFDISQIAPTENDLYFRKQVLQGYVHDPAAAMMGGASGHAGLFSNANDLAKLMQLYLNGGSYGKHRFIQAKTIDLFTGCYNCNNGNRRGLGFDKPNTDTTGYSPVCKSASPATYGHTGFTGTATWADPETGLLFVFLSNRVFPDVVHNKLATLDVRTNIQQVFYEALLDK